MNLHFSEDEEKADLLRAILDRDRRRDVQATACLSLGQVLKEKADALPPDQAKSAGKLRKESEKLLERAASKFADVKSAFRDETIGAVAKRELYELRNLAVGMKAPAVKGVDQDGKEFALSDYQGKVVLLDFWSEF